MNIDELREEINQLKRYNWVILAFLALITFVSTKLTSPEETSSLTSLSILVVIYYFWNEYVIWKKKMYLEKHNTPED